jgi:hypothetical protein
MYTYIHTYTEYIRIALATHLDLAPLQCTNSRGTLVCRIFNLHMCAHKFVCMHLRVLIHLQTLTHSLTNAPRFFVGMCAYLAGMCVRIFSG